MDSDDKKITQLTQVTSLSDSDLFVVAIDVGTAPKTRAITKTNAFADVTGGGGGEGILVNGKISVSVASNNITVAIKTLAGADPSAGDPVTIQIDGVVRSLTSALSVTVNAGTNTFNAGAAEFATLEIDYFPYLSWRAASSALVLGFSRVPYANLYSQFSATATNELYAAFSTAPAGTDTVVNIGRFAAINSGSASYNWSVPSSTAENLKQRPTFETRLLSYVPQWTNLTVGDGTNIGLYQFFGKECFDYIDFTFGSTSAVTGAVSASMPMTKLSSILNGVPIFTARMFDSSLGSPSFAGLAAVSTNTCTMLAQDSSVAYLRQALLSSTVPFTWAVSDKITTFGNYPIAA